MVNEFVTYLLENRKSRKIRLFFDIETLQYNTENAKNKPTLNKNVTYSVAISYYDFDELKICLFPNFKHFFDCILNTYSKWKNNPTFELIAHNTNKYDNHFLRDDICYYYDAEIRNLHLKQATETANEYAVKKKEITREEKESIILEKRVKSHNNLEMDFYLNNIRFYTTDNLMKTSTSLQTLGFKLLKLGYLTEDELKTDYDYKKFNRTYDMTPEQARDYAMKVFKSLTEDELTYIRNDVIILAKSVRYYSQIFKGFDYEKITFTSNILTFYNDNDLTDWQLLKKNGKNHIKYTDYRFGHENLYDFLKPFYRGGANVYNYKKLDKLIKHNIIAMDINSSYPYAMHYFKVPTFLKEYEYFDKPKKIDITLSDDIYYLYRLSKHDFDKYITRRIKSEVVRKTIVKYYSTTSDFMNINSYTIRILEKFLKKKIIELPVLSYMCFECHYFGSREHISEQYYIKTQGSNKNKIIYNSPYDITVTDEKNKNVFSQEEIDNSKIILNGLYGIPALRPYFNIFRRIGDDYMNIPNGFMNSERNIVFSIFVTSIAFWNLLLPLSYLEPDNIDEWFIYADTDSLYLYEEALEFIPTDLFDDNHLGKWGIDNDTITMMKVLNHKKYAYYGMNKKTGEYEITVRAGGIPKNTFDTNMSFEQFSETQFYDGAYIPNDKAIYNEQGTISFYESQTHIEKGFDYPIYADSWITALKREEMFKEIRNQLEDTGDDALYIESEIGSFSMQELYPVTREITGKKHILYLLMEEERIKQMLGL